MWTIFIFLFFYFVLTITSMMAEILDYYKIWNNKYVKRKGDRIFYEA